MFPAFAHFRRTATRDTELGGQPIREGDKVVIWYVSSNRDESRYDDPDRFDVGRNPEHQAFGAGGRHFCLGARSRGSSCGSSSRKRWRASRRWSRRGARVRGVAVHQPAQDAAGPAATVTGFEQLSCPGPAARVYPGRPSAEKNSISSRPTRSGSS